MYVFIVLLIGVWVVFSVSWHSSSEALNIFVCVSVSMYARVSLTIYSEKEMLVMLNKLVSNFNAYL